MLNDKIRKIEIVKCKTCGSKVMKITTNEKNNDGTYKVQYEKPGKGDISISALITELEKKVQ